MRVVVYVGKAGRHDAGSNARGGLVRAVRDAESALSLASVTWVDRWENGAGSIGDTDCVVVVGSRVLPSDLPSPRASRGVVPPVVVVTSQVHQAALSLRRVAVEEIVEGDPARIVAAIRVAARNSLFLRSAEAVENHPDLSRRLAAWLALTLERNPPFATVKQSAKAVPWEPSTIRSDWAREIGFSSPKEWLSMVQFARAVRLRGGSSWTEVAEALGVSLRTLERRSQQVGREGLRAVADDPSPFEDTFERYVQKVLEAGRARRSWAS